ncbi:hypothetical protein M409DRAFT_27958 [Zasmidium cellare ATCC 36951]|uniref:Uncharacterized protein n=1 Tax=Zasmidium cellare ATCC 36951 TaxID=1080233 RepID=A0A6A6C6P8_ZASCE|nr:uncharacterized protein M409DRAFT_27958 [Zasmidium cellare ATCC 36951]KAF2161562.1 hypothetical protein M409DRAFT_27958 [Zasmidium cellare ATCC 36951]
MDYFCERILQAAERKERFVSRPSELHYIRDEENQPVVYKTTFPYDESEHEKLPEAFLYQPSPLPTTKGTLKLLFKKSRPRHISGKPDKFPFADASCVRRIFQDLDLPQSYFHISSGSLVLARSNVVREEDGTPSGYEFIAHCPSTQGDWALALSHSVATRTTSAYWSVDHRIDSKTLLSDLAAFQSHAFHPMLIPIIMFSSILQRALDRRIAMKSKLTTLEETILLITQKAAKTTEEDFQEFNWYFKQPGGMETMFELLESCRREQTSRKGRYQYWEMLYKAILEGMEYAEVALAHVRREDFRRVQEDLKQWVALTWMKFESLRARDEDHVSRVNDASDMLYNLVQQRDSRIQANLARATQKDSEDMKFIALLGSVFLPASFVATVLGVDRFQFLPGPQLFGVYIGITIPLIAVVVTLCLLQPRWRGSKAVIVPSLHAAA